LHAERGAGYVSKWGKDPHGRFISIPKWYVTGMLLILIIAVPVGMALAVALELATGRGERIDTWIADSHPLFARPEPDPPHMTTETSRNLRHRPTRLSPGQAARIGNARLGVAPRPQRRRALRYH
jgi:hypothetical protein